MLNKKNNLGIKGYHSGVKCKVLSPPFSPNVILIRCKVSVKVYIPKFVMLKCAFLEDVCNERKEIEG